MPIVEKTEATRVVGVYAYSEHGKVFLYDEGCVVAGSEQAIKIYLEAFPPYPNRNMRVSKLRFGEIFDGLTSGAAYAFDKEAYARFYSLARRAGVDDLDGFPDKAETPLQFMKVRFDRAGQ